LVKLLISEDDPFIFLVMVSGCSSVGKICESEVFRVTQVSFINLGTACPDDEKVTEVRHFCTYDFCIMFPKS